jgi:cyanate lyase
LTVRPPPTRTELTQRAICGRIFAPAPPDYPAASRRDYCSGAFSLDVTGMIRAAKVQKNISWAGVATAIGQSKEWTTAGCLGQMAFNKAQAEKIGAIFGLSDEAVAWLQIAPYKGSLPTAVPADPLIYRWYEIVAVYGNHDQGINP